MLAAIYARKSTDQSGVTDDAKSVARQVDHARDYCQRKGWQVLDECIYVDDGISGAEFGSKRPGLLQLLNTLKPKPPFQVLVMSEESRLGREAIETAFILKQLVQAHVQVWFYLEDRQRTLESPTDKLLMHVAAFADEVERDKARQRTFDAMRRKALAGHVCGGLVYGYTNHPVLVPGPDGKPRRSHVERRILPAEAAVVQQVFQLAADGYGKARIARTLNQQQVPAPRVPHDVPSSWSSSTVNCILHRPLYKGVIVWNQSKKRDQWGQRAQKPRPEQDWLVVPAPHLQIVSDEVWDAAHAELDRKRTSYLRSTRGQLMGRPPRDDESKYLLTGFVQCGVCGKTIQVRTYKHGRQRAPFYACASYFRKGSCVCMNNSRVKLEDLDHLVLQTLEDVVLQPDVVEAALQQALDKLAPGVRQAEVQRLQRELAEVEQRLERLTAAVATGGQLPSLLERLQQEEQHKVDLQAQLATAQHLAVTVSVDQIRTDLVQRLQEWRQLLRTHVAQSRQMLRKLLDGPLTLTPLEDGQVQVDGRVSYDKVLTGLVPAALPHSVASPAGFEPAFRP